MKISTLFISLYSILQYVHCKDSGQQYFTTLPDIEYISSDHVNIRIWVSSTLQYLLDLRANRQFVSSTLKYTTVSNGSHPARLRQSSSPTVASSKQKKTKWCHFEGNVVGSKLPSLAAISYCDGALNGMFEADGTVYHLKQSNNDRAVRVSTENAILHCGFNQNSIENVSTQRLHRLKRDIIDNHNEAFNVSRYVELVIVNDHRVYQKYGKNTDFIFERSTQIANIVNALYTPLNIHVVLVGVVIWTEKDEIEISTDSSVMLTNFLEYRKNRLFSEHPNDNAQLITGTTFEAGVVGKALKQTMCTFDYSGGVNSDYSESISLVATTIAHELGHNFGMEHDHSDCECPAKNCIMGPSSSFPTPKNWSKCSIRQVIDAFDHGIDQCLFNKPRSVFKPNCGNGLIDAGEECDCGPADSCTNSCCDPKTCKFKPEAECANGECCDRKTCKIMSSERVCRPERGFCDIEEKCTGYSEHCPKDAYVKDGTECEPGYSFCAHGKCHNREQQCKRLWGDSSEVGDYRCYQHNTNATSSGNCGYNKQTKKFIPCDTLKDAICGRLHCVHPGPEKLKYGPEGAATISLSKEIRRGKVIMCHSAMIDMGLDEQDPGLVPDGAKCSANSMCFQQRCVPTSKFVLDNPCPYNCHGNGKCDNDGICHCFDGYSANDCSSTIGRIFNISVYILFFVLLPILALIVALKYFRTSIKNWFSKRQFGTQSEYHNNKKSFESKLTVAKHDISVPLQSIQSANHPRTTTFSTQPPPLPRSAPVATVQPRQHSVRRGQTIPQQPLPPVSSPDSVHFVPVRPAPPVPGAAMKRPETPPKPQFKPMQSASASSSASTNSSTVSRPVHPPPPPPPLDGSRPQSRSSTKSPPPPIPAHKPSLLKR